MNILDIKPGVVIWNEWTYSIMGRDTGTKNSYFLITSVIEVTKYEGKNGQKYGKVECVVKDIENPTIEKPKPLSFTEEEILNGNLRMATKSELKKILIENKSHLEQKILEHKTEIQKLELSLSDLDSNYKEFIDKAL